jgi:hypothetical protein
VHPDRQFLHALDDIARHTTRDQSEWNVLDAGGRLRALLTDKPSLLDHVNRTRRLRIRFSIIEPDARERRLATTNVALWYMGDGLDPETALIGKAIAVPLDRFLARVVIIAENTHYTVLDVIRTAAHDLGAVHAGPADRPKEVILGKVDDRVRIGGTEFAHMTGAVVSTIRPIARVTLRALEALRARVVEDLDQSRSA